MIIYSQMGIMANDAIATRGSPREMLKLELAIRNTRFTASQRHLALLRLTQHCSRLIISLLSSCSVRCNYDDKFLHAITHSTEKEALVLLSANPHVW